MSETVTKKSKISKPSWLKVKLPTGENFKQVDHVFDPSKNVTYAVNYLRKHKKDRDWWRSVGRYHSGTEKHAKRYIENVWEMYQKVHRLPSV